MKRFVSFFTFTAVSLLALPAFAQEGGMANGAVAFAAAFAISVAAFGGALGQGKAAAAALEGIARNPGAANKIQGPFILGLALIESLCIYALVIGFLLQAKL